MNIGSRIIQAREARGWQQKTLAEVLDRLHIMTQQSLSLLELGKTQSTRHGWELAAVLGVSPRWLVTGEGSMNDENAQALMPLPPASDQVQPLLARLYEMDKAGELPAPVVEGLLRLLDGIQSHKTI